MTAETEIIDVSVASGDQEIVLPEAGQVPARADSPESTALIQVIERAALNPDIDIDKMERLLLMQERIIDKQAEGDFNLAMAETQAEIQPVSADAENPQTRSKFASYAQLDRAVRKIYTRHGFSLSFDMGEGAPEGHVRVLCYAGHRGGHTRTYHADMPADGKGAKGGDVMTKTHAAGAAFSYGQRYLLKLIFNIAVGDDDNDGNGVVILITAPQKEKLIALMREVNADSGKFLNYLGIDYIDALPADRFDGALKALEAKRKKGGE